ncbi:MAG TPA: alpha/beta fold hydrolase [Dehalococcoidia bacterium]|jgi:class 3 adenylate cyclase|nr:alpha/beta fold hydrolase [Dehalococcoidia bacterium]
MEQDIRFCKTSDGVRIAYATSGVGPPLVRVLGWFTHLEYEWENPLWRSGIDVWSANHLHVRYDGRCMGLSDRGVRKLGLEESVLDLETVIDAAGLERVALLALSAGGPTGITYAIRHPERVSRLVLYGSFVRLPGTTEERKMMLEMVHHGWDSDVPAHRQFFTGLFIPDNPDADAIRAFNEIQRVSATADDVVAWMSALPDDFDLRDDLPKVQTPTLVIHRRGDAIVPFELGREIAAGIPGARFLPLDGRNHWPLPSEPVWEAMGRAIEEFLGTGDQPKPTPSSPSGLVTILFTDMVGSTDLTQRVGDDRAQEAVRQHNTAVRDALKAHAGKEIKHTGDGIMASFASARGAVDCAIAIQRALDAGDSVRVRIGLNAGEPVAEEQDLYGTSVQLAARVCAEADAGEILVSNVVRELAAGKGFLFNDRGDHALKGFEDPVRVYEVRWRE